MKLLIVSDDEEYQYGEIEDIQEYDLDKPMGRADVIEEIKMAVASGEREEEKSGDQDLAEDDDNDID